VSNVAPPKPNEPDKNLERAAVWVTPSIRRAIQAEYIVRAAEMYFAAQKEPEKAFRTNPANTMSYQSLVALVDHLIIHVAETLTNLPPELKIRVPIRRKGDLVMHRHAVSHPTQVKWDGGMQRFMDDDRAWLDDRAAILWDLQKSINEELRKRGQRTFEDDIPVTEEMSSILFLILVHSLSDDYQAPPRPHLLGWLNDAKANFVKNLESRPDGRRTPAAPRAASSPTDPATPPKNS
jgi:hypothetical protein